MVTCLADLWSFLLYVAVAGFLVYLLALRLTCAYLHLRVEVGEPFA